MKEPPPGPPAREDPAAPLTTLGFTALEAAAYTWLLQRSPATGYGVAKGIGKAVANTYKALASLEEKGAVLVEATGNRLCRAVPPEEVMARLERSFAESRRLAARSLAKLERASEDDRVYQLRTREQVLERCRWMLGRAKQVALLDIFPGALPELRDALEAAARRKVRVAVLVYEPVRIAGGEAVLQYRAPETLARWKGHWIHLVADSAEHLAALLSEDGNEVRHATWSASAFLAHLAHGGLAGEIANSALRRRIAEGASAEALRALVLRLDRYLVPESVGYRRLAKPRRKAGPR